MGTGQQTREAVIAISDTKFNNHGCPYCGCINGDMTLEMDYAMVWNCAQCGKGCVVLGFNEMGKNNNICKQVIWSPFGIGFGDLMIHPKLQRHPRDGTAGHALLIKTESSAELPELSPGIGLHVVMGGCFVCGDVGSIEHPNMYLVYAFTVTVKGGTAAEALVGLFGDIVNHGGKETSETSTDNLFGSKGTLIDYGDDNENVRVRIGSCFGHLPNLRHLHELVKSGNMTADKIAEARAVSSES